MNWPERVWIYSPVRVFFLRRQAERWLRLAGERKAEKVLEIGCGPGRGARILVQKMGFGRVFGLDLDPKVIRDAVDRLSRRLDNRISFFVGDAQTLPFADREFDAVVNYGIIHHILDWRQAIGEISRVLKPGCMFYFEEIYPPLYANFLLKRLVRHPSEDRFDGPQFLETLGANNLRLLDGVNTRSRFGIVGAAVKAFP